MAMTAEERKKRFEESQKIRKQAQQNQGGYEREPIPTFEYLAIGQDKCKVFRMVGESLEMRKSPSDPILVERALVKADDDKYFTLIWSQDPTHPLRKLMKTLAAYTWDKTLNSGKGARVYTNEGCELLKKFLTNNDPNEYATGMMPQKYVVFNVIDRMDSWCRDNKHTKLIAWDSSEKDGKTFYTAGITQGMYKKIFDEKCSTIRRHFEEWDQVVRRFTKKTQPDQSTHNVIHFYEEKSAIQNWSDKDKIDYYSLINQEDYLSDEELLYERYPLENVPFLSKVTPMGVIMNKIGNFIKAVDKKYGTNIYEQCVEWKAQEISASKNKGGETEEEHPQEHNSGGSDLPSQEEKPVSTPAKAPEVPSNNNVGTSRVKTRKETNMVGHKWTAEELDLFPALAKLSEDDKSLIVRIDLNNQEIIWVDGDKFECPDCQADIGDVQVCPHCAAQF